MVLADIVHSKFLCYILYCILAKIPRLLLRKDNFNLALFLGSFVSIFQVNKLQCEISFTTTCNQFWDKLGPETQ